MPKVKEWRKLYYENSNQRKTEVFVLISDKVDFRIRKIIKDKKGHYIMIKGSIIRDVSTLMCIHLTTEHHLYEAKTDRTEKKNREIYNYSWRSQHPSISN